jgi:hypothetical protein
MDFDNIMDDDPWNNERPSIKKAKRRNHKLFLSVGNARYMQEKERTKHLVQQSANNIRMQLNREKDLMVKTANKSLRESNNLLEKMVKESRNAMSPISMNNNNKKGTNRTAHSSALAHSYQFIGGKKEVLSRLYTSLNQSLAQTGPTNTVSPSTTNVKMD